MSLWRGGDGGDGLVEEKTLELRMQSVILVTRVPPTPPPKEWSSLSGGGGEGRNTSDRRTDPKISCICGDLFGVIFVKNEERRERRCLRLDKHTELNYTNQERRGKRERGLTFQILHMV